MPAAAPYREILVTSALPYANGPIHVGHLLEYVQTDIWVRFQRLRGYHCLYVCADDAHGSPVMLKAHELGLAPEALIEQMHREHFRDFTDFFISFDYYYSTHSEENRALSRLIYGRLVKNGHITSRVIRQAYDDVKGMFLPDRFIKGSCPECGAPGQYGDNCEACGATYSPGDLVDPVSVLTGTTPVERESEHYFFRLSDFTDMLRGWLTSREVQPAIHNKLEEWLGDGLKDWDISRDAPYFGFEIPGTGNKYFYVWLDAPIGYMASFRKLCERDGLDFDHYWKPDSSVELHHFIGKDIAYFHTLFWPAMLSGSGFRTPSAVHCHGFVTINGQKMSKSRGTFITARQYLNLLSPEYLRYYFASRLSSGIDDIDLNLRDLASRVNGDLVGKVVNIASRCSVFINRYFNDEILTDGAVKQYELYQSIVHAADGIARSYEARDYAGALRCIMALADEANRFIDGKKPWAVIKSDGPTHEVHCVCSSGLIAFAYLINYLKPVLPQLAERTEQFMNVTLTRWGTVDLAAPKHRCRKFTPLLRRIDQKAVSQLADDHGG